AWAQAVLAVRDRDVDDPSAYTAATASNLIRMHRRRESSRRRWAPRLFSRPTVDAPDGEVVHREEADAMAVALEHVPPAARDLLIRHTIHGQDTRSLAAATGSTPAAVAASLARARAILRVEYLIAFRRLPPPPDRCRNVLYAVSGADRRRQDRLDATRHIMACPSCRPIAADVRDRKRANIGLLLAARFGAADGTTPPRGAGPPVGAVAAAGIVGVLAFGQTAAVPHQAPVHTAAVTAVSSAGHQATLAHRLATHTVRSGKKIDSSRAADSGPSLPCTKFSVSNTPKSPLMVPGAASAGL